MSNPLKVEARVEFTYMLEDGDQFDVLKHGAAVRGAVAGLFAPPAGDVVVDLLPLPPEVDHEWCRCGADEEQEGDA